MSEFIVRVLRPDVGMKFPYEDRKHFRFDHVGIKKKGIF